MTLAQGLSNDGYSPSQQSESDLGEGVIAYNFIMRGLPASDGEEVKLERTFEAEESSNQSFLISQEEAIGIAIDELGSSEWELDEAEQDDGLHELEFTRGDSEAELEIDGSTGTITEFEAEVEYEPQDEASAVLSGFIQFSNDRYEVDTDIEVNEETNEAYFEAEIEEENDAGATVVSRESIEEFEDAEPGKYTGTLEVIRNNQVVHTEKQEFNVPGPRSNTSEESEETHEELEEMSRDDLIEEVRALRAQVESLKDQLSQTQSEETSSNPEQDQANETDEETNEDTEELGEEQDSEDLEDSTEQSDDEDDIQEPETPGQSDNRPGFVDRMLSGLIGN